MDRPASDASVYAMIQFSQTNVGWKFRGLKFREQATPLPLRSRQGHGHAGPGADSEQMVVAGMIVVADTSPLNYLIRLGRPDVLREI